MRREAHRKAGLLARGWAALGRLLGVGTEVAMEKELLRKARGDRALAERLVAFERRRAPGGTRREWVQDAVRRLDRDNR